MNADEKRDGLAGDGATVIHYGRFVTSPVRHGGTRRAQQLREILERNGAQVVNLALATNTSRGLARRIGGVARGLTISPLRELPRVRRPAGPYHRAMADLAFARALRGLPVIWEGGPGEAFYGGWAARRHGHRVVAVPQNFDSLTRGMASSWTGRRAPDWFDEEVHELAHADAVFVLSPNDRWLLSLHGVEARVLRYHPPTDVEQQLRNLRREREQTDRDPSVLALGTVGSEPTAQGFRDLRRILEGSAARHVASGLVVAGFGTEQLRSEYEAVGARVLGSLSEADLRAEQLRARALLVHYVPAPGALTRVVEALMAGIPVIANRHAARGYESLEGIYLYESVADLARLMTAELPMPPAPPRPEAEALFAASVLSTG